MKFLNKRYITEAWQNSHLRVDQRIILIRTNRISACLEETHESNLT
jgi:hypothetical protein